MRKPPQSASIWRLLATAYLVLMIPAFLFVKFTCNALDYRIEQAQYSLSDGDKFALDTHPRNAWIMSFGGHLRELNMPFAVSSKLDPQSTRNSIVALNLSDVRAALIYIWAGIFMFGAIAIIWLGFLLNRPLQKLTGSIERLTKGELAKSISIYGPRNIQEMGDGLEKLRQRLQESDKQQKLFLRHISHEIKTPLTSIKEGSKLLDEQLLGPINDEQHEVSQILVKSSNELQVAIENLLHYSSAISQKSKRQYSLVDLSLLVYEALEKHELPIKQKTLVLDLSIASCQAHADKVQILTVFDNLISNAVKHSPDGGTLSLELRPLKKDVAEFIVRDEGPGINKDQEHAIFDAFFVGDQSVKTTLKGTGLGLSIAKQYVDAHEGTIQLLSTRKGAAFRVVLG